MNPAQHILVLGLRIYRAVVSPVLTAVFAPLGFGCRFRPTCSEYAIEAVRRHGALKGAALAGRRLCRCHPWAESGYDPVPDPHLETPGVIDRPSFSEGRAPRVPRISMNLLEAGDSQSSSLRSPAIGSPLPSLNSFRHGS